MMSFMVERMAIKWRLSEKTDVKDLFYDEVYKMPDNTV